MPKTHDALTVTFDPTWPWSTSGLGLYALLFVALVLIGLTVWTYRGLRGVTLPRLLALVGLRLLALFLACLVVMRPSIAYQD